MNVKIIMAAISIMVALMSLAEMVPSDISMAMFMSGRIQEPTVFKVKMSISPMDYSVFGSLSGRFSEDECRKLFWAVRVRPYKYRNDSGFGGSIVCVVKKNSEAGNIIKEKLKDGGWHGALVQMRYSSNPQCRECCVIDEVEMLVSEKPSEIKVRFANTRVGVTKGKDYDYLQGTITAIISSKNKYFKKPILRVVLLTDENGSRVVRDVLVNEPNLQMVGSSDTLTRFTTTSGNSENEPWDAKRQYIEELSSNQSEVSKEAYAKVSYVGLPLGTQIGYGIKGSKIRTMFGFSKFDKDENAKLIGYRIEMWQNGGCVAVHDTLSSGIIKRLELPEDWHISFKHPNKFKYRGPFSRKSVVRD
jgi:hypothetical protein